MITVIAGTQKGEIVKGGRNIQKPHCPSIRTNTAIGYQVSFIYKDVDDALDSVLAFFSRNPLIESASYRIIRHSG